MIFNKINLVSRVLDVFLLMILGLIEWYSAEDHNCNS